MVGRKDYSDHPAKGSTPQGPDGGVGPIADANDHGGRKTDGALSGSGASPSSSVENIGSNYDGEEEQDGELLKALARQLHRYTSEVLESRSAPPHGREESSIVEHQRATIRDTRLALRFALAWVARSLASTDDDKGCHQYHEGEETADHDASRNNGCARRCRRERLQQCVLEATEAYLYRILLSHGDPKCRLYAARLLCNLVTDNATAAQRVLGESIQLDPGRDALLDRQRRGILGSHEEDAKKGNSDDDDDDDSAPWHSELGYEVPNWLDVILNNGDRRDVLAAIVATLHNAIAAIEPSSHVPDATSASCPYSRQLAAHGLVMNSLLRQVVASQSIISPPSNNPANDETARPLDDASDWILVLVRGLVRRGCMRTLYGTVSGNGAGGTETSRGYHALPEHVVLLFCLRQQLESEGHDGQSLLVSLCDESTDTIDAVVFLAGLYADLSLSTAEMKSETDVSSPPAVSDSTSRMERVSVQLRVLDLLGDLLQDDTNAGDLEARARSAVGHHPSFLQQLSRDVAALVDSYAQSTPAAEDEPGSNPSSTTGRRVTIPPQDQERLTSSVRLLGNLCYRCRHNQDLLRSIAVPSTTASSSSTESPVRNVLHVLMTSTSLAPYCFTLREWAVVAIRNALEDNAENQSVLADLQAQQPASSTVLSDMGVRIDLDAGTGRVHVVPLDEANSASNGSGTAER